MEVELAARLVPLEGGVNFRDLGGYSTADGRTVKWRHLYRSGMMTRLTENDAAALEERGIRMVVDFRTATEQQEEPNHWALASEARYWAREHEETFGQLKQMAATGIGSVEEAQAIMLAGYRHLPFQQAQAYAEIFRALAGGEVPLVFHCTAGKDRTGGAAALVLSLLGVPRETIAMDFNMTERAVDLRKALGSAPRKGYEGFASIAPEVGQVISGAHPEWILALLDAVEEQCGSVEGYARDMGLSAGDLAEMRAHLLD
ncbi:MAG: tyrosine-protein phosphatase [Novosphingobium sp.]